MSSQEIEIEVYRKYPRTESERKCAIEREQMNKVRNYYRVRLQNGMTPQECEFDIEKIRSKKIA